ncbi:acryloyl-CoA reductase [Fodinisporobacter ferrooxydans]|uniref:Acryloyl-CoA reductase n=1 Tax=Fodinisporobacter ferrooxydans TaxID=2901836 RepID=A0ABY4CHJ6_9BACL|nr:acryloyl-CoA reductase [Alicyclobacillaceae bacterium MYW30-H2]
MEAFQALVVNKREDMFAVSLQEMSFAELPEGEVLIRVMYSSVNYKDGLAADPNGRIVRSYPFVPGIDLAGIVESSEDSRFAKGDQVLVTGYDMGVSHFGGFSQFARVRADWVVPLPEALTLKAAMVFGTAGFTAALSIHKLEQNGIRPEKGTILVTGATGGVGSMAVAMLAKRGYHVAASTGKTEEHAYLQNLGAKEILHRTEVSPESFRPLDKQRWAAAVDPVGGRTLAYILSTTQYGGSVAVSGLTGGTDVPTTVFPFILRGINLLGIDSVYCPMDIRMQVWNQMANEWKPETLLQEIGQEIPLEQLPNVLPEILKGNVRGRTIVNVGER